MKQYFLILNSVLLGLLLATTYISRAYRFAPPRNPWHKQQTKQVETSLPELASLPFSQIHGRRNIFVKQEDGIKATKKSFLKKAPPLQLPPPASPPKRVEVAFIDPLKISLSGIIMASSEEDSMCIVADETNKEKTYHLSDSIGDGLIIKISRQSMVVLRANGQQETYFLHGIAPGADSFGGKVKKNIANKLPDGTFAVHPAQFKEQIPSLGEGIEEFGLSALYHQGVSVGVVVGQAKKPDFLLQLGLQQGDIILNINNFDLTTSKGRTNAYDSVKDTVYGGSITATIRRNNKAIPLTYKLERPKTSIVSGEPGPTLAPTANNTTKTPTPTGPIPPTFGKEQFTAPKRDITQERKRLKEQRNQQYNDNIAAVRKRLLENMKRRQQRPRVR